MRILHNSKYNGKKAKKEHILQIAQHLPISLPLSLSTSKISFPRELCCEQKGRAKSLLHLFKKGFKTLTSESKDSRRDCDLILWNKKAYFSFICICSGETLALSWRIVICKEISQRYSRSTCWKSSGSRDHPLVVIGRPSKSMHERVF